MGAGITPTVMAKILAGLVPTQRGLVAVTLRFPAVAEPEKLIVTLLVVLEKLAPDTL